MRFACGMLLLSLGGAASAWTTQATSSPAATPSPSPSPSPSPATFYKLAPYGFESPKDPSTVPLLRFEEKTEVQALEMNAAIARFFDSGDEKSSTARGAAPGAPTVSQMGPYRPHVTQGLNFLGLASFLRNELANQSRIRRQKRGDEMLRELLLKAASPTPTPSPSPTPGLSFLR